MNIFSKVTLKTLAKNRTRTFVTIVGIILSAAMITAVTTLISSLQAYLLDTMVYMSGNWHASLAAVPAKVVAQLKDDDELSQVVQGQNIGYAMLEGSKNEGKPYLFVLGAEKTFMEEMPVHLINGNLPESENEIILPKHVQTNAGVYYSIGDTLELDVGDRVSDGYILRQGNRFLDGENGDSEELITRGSRTYTVVGFYERPDFEPSLAPGYTAITIMDSQPSATYTYDAYFTLDNPKQVKSYMSKFEDYSKGYNDDVLMFVGASRFDTYYATLYSFAAILIGLIMFGSISLIYNAFSISVSERTKQFGLLSSIGATKRQLARSVLFEGLFVSLIGIPIGIICGIAGIGVTLSIIGSNFIMFSQVNIPLTLNISPLSVVVAIVIAAVTVLISAWIPSRRATKVTAIEAIRQSADITAKAKQVKTSKLIYMLFGLEGALAKKHFKRSRKRYRATVISLFMSIVLFVSTSSLCTYLSDSMKGIFSSADYDVIYYMPQDKEPNQIFEVLSNVEGVEKASYAGLVTGIARLPVEVVNDRLLEYVADENNEYANVPIILYSVDDATFEAYLKENNLSKDDYFNADNPLGIATAKVIQFIGIEGKYHNFDVFKDSVTSENLANMPVIIVDETATYEDDIPADEYKTIELSASLGLIADELAFGVGVNTGNGIVVMYPQSVIESVVNTQQIKSYSCYFKVDKGLPVFDNMVKALEHNKLPTSSLVNYADSVESTRNIILIFEVFSYGFIVLISLIAMANVFNTISTNIALRRREFAMLKSIGMTKRGFNKMMRFECLLYGAKSLLWGLPVSVAVTYLIFKATNETWEVKFYMPIVPVIIAVLSVFTVVIITMMYSMSKIAKDNPIDALKNENL